MGRLSNPSTAAEALLQQGSTARLCSSPALNSTCRQPPKKAVGGFNEEEGRLSNPLQRRLREEDINRLVRLYLSGLTINATADRMGIHRTTVIHHLKASGVSRRRHLRKMSDPQVMEAAARYATGISLASVAEEFSVHEGTLTREFRKAGVPIRSRRGWNP